MRGEEVWGRSSGAIYSVRGDGRDSRFVGDVACAVVGNDEDAKRGGFYFLGENPLEALDLSAKTRKGSLDCGLG